MAKTMTYDQFLATLGTRSEMFGLLGIGFPTSFYRVFVRTGLPDSDWWNIGSGPAAPARFDPVKKHVERMAQGNAVAVVWCPLQHLVEYDHIADSGLSALTGRVHALLRQQTREDL